MSATASSPASSWPSVSERSNSLSLLDYYSKRAAEYERIYLKPERQADLTRLRERLQSLLAGRRVLEVACGTGYWTAAIAEVAATLTATDASDEALAIARAKGFERSGVALVRADAWRADERRGDFDAGFAAFWWSHILRQQLAAFLVRFHGALRPGARVVFADNRFVSGSSTPLSRTDEAGNTWQLRRLEDGSSHEVLKNFPTRAELVAQVEPYARAVEVIEFDYFWCLSYELL